MRFKAVQKISNLPIVLPFFEFPGSRKD